MVVFGHYWRIPVRKVAGERLFNDLSIESVLRGGRAMCIDYSVGGRAAERRAGKTGGFSGRLAALRWPERELAFDDGEVRAMREAV